MDKTKYLVVRDNIIVHFRGKTLTIHKADPRHAKVLAAIEAGQLESIPAIADNEATEEIRNLLKIRRKRTE